MSQSGNYSLITDSEKGTFCILHLLPGLDSGFSLNSLIYILLVKIYCMLDS